MFEQFMFFSVRIFLAFCVQVNDVFECQEMMESEQGIQALQFVMYSKPIVAY